MTSRTAGRYVAYGLFALGFGYCLWSFTLLMRAGASFSEALTAVLNDPGKHLFHLILFPVAGYLAVAEFPFRLLQRRWRRVRLWLAPIPLLVFIGVAYVVHDATTVFEGTTGALRPAFISDVQDVGLRRTLVEFDRWARDSTHGHEVLIYETGGPNDAVAPPDLDRSQVRLTAFARLQQGQWSSGTEDFGKGTIRLRRIPNAARPSFASDATACAWLGALLSALGPLVTAWILGCLVLFVVPQEAPTSREWNALLCVIGILLMWLPLVSYSQWYMQYQEKFNYPPLGLAAVAAVVLFAVAWLARNGPRSGLVVLLGSAAAPVLGAIDGLFNSGRTVEGVGRLVSDLGLFGMLALYVMFGFLCALIARVVLRTPP